MSERTSRSHGRGYAAQFWSQEDTKTSITETVEAKPPEKAEIFPLGWLDACRQSPSQFDVMPSTANQGAGRCSSCPPFKDLRTSTDRLSRHRRTFFNSSPSYASEPPGEEPRPHPSGLASVQEPLAKPQAIQEGLRGPSGELDLGAPEGKVAVESTPGGRRDRRHPLKSEYTVKTNLRDQQLALVVPGTLRLQVRSVILHRKHKLARQSRTTHLIGTLQIDW